VCVPPIRLCVSVCLCRCGLLWTVQKAGHSCKNITFPLSAGEYESKYLGNGLVRSFAIRYLLSSHLHFSLVAFVALALHFLGTQRPTHMHTENSDSVSTSHLKRLSAVTYFRCTHSRGNHLWKFSTVFATVTRRGVLTISIWCFPAAPLFIRLAVPRFSGWAPFS